MNNLPKRDAELFAELLQVPLGQRDACLASACGDDDALRQRLRKLLEANDELGDFLDKPFSMSGNPRPTIFIGEKPGAVIGRYKLLEQIGEGGCGVVFMAEQQEPVRREVALKIIKPGMDTKSVIARFEAERQALALMNHPNIAKVFDAGATDSGRPYFVMELVRGVKITDYCDKHSLKVEERLELFTQVCQAIQHAHQKGIIHRDIKPSNILVTITSTGEPLPVVIDFGIAKATNNQELTDKTIFTAFEMLIGTPAYMSPEQAALGSVDIDTRTDIYSLGVLLYELLTSSTPIESEELQKAGLDAMRRAILEKEPLRPSTRLHRIPDAHLTTIAQHRGAEPARLIRAISGDLDWIAMKAMDKDRTRRYETANGLAMDVERFLAHEAVSACPPSNLYRLQKTLRRNRPLFIGLGIIATLLILSLIVVSVSLARERRSQREEGMVKQFLEDMLNLDPTVVKGRDTALLHEILDKAAANIGKLTNQPAVEGELLNVIGTAYERTGQYPQAEEMQRTALQICRKCSGPESLETAASLNELGLALIADGKPLEAEQVNRQALAIRRRLLGEDNTDVATSEDNLAHACNDNGEFREAETLERQALVTRRKLCGNESQEVADSLRNLALILVNTGRVAEGEATMRQVFALRCKLLGSQNPTVASSLYDLAWAVGANGKQKEASALEQEAFALLQKVTGNYADIAHSLYLLGNRMLQRGDLEDAYSVLSATLSLQRKLLGDDHPETLDTLNSLGLTCQARNNWSGAESVWRQLLASRRKQSGNDDPQTLYAIRRLAGALEEQGKLSEADQLLAEVLTPAFLNEPACSNILACRLNLRGRQGKWGEAVADISLLVKYQPSEQYDWHILAALLAMTRNRPAYQTSCPKILAMVGDTSNLYIDERVAEDCLFLPGSGVDLTIADKLADKAVSLGSGWQDLPYFQVAKAMSAYRLGHYTEAIDWSRKTLKGAIIYPDAHAYAVLAMAYWELGQKDMARTMLEKGDSLTPDISHSPEPVDLGDSWTAWLEARISLNEADALIQSSSKTGRASQRL